MERFDRMSLKKWAGPAAGALALAGLLAALSTAVLGAFDSGAQAPEVIHRTARPATPTRTPTISPTPTITLTPSETPTPTLTPTPFPEKDPAGLGNTVIVGGSTGSSFLRVDGIGTVSLFDGGGGPLVQSGHVIFPGALTHLTVKLSPALPEGLGYFFNIDVNGKQTSVKCQVPAKGKGDFCESGDKEGECIDLGPQDTIAVRTVPFATGSGSELAGVSPFSNIRMSWVAKLDLYGQCPIAANSPPVQGEDSCEGANACDGASGRINAHSCNVNDACRNQTGSIGQGSCNGDNACTANSERLGNQSCNGDNACHSSTGDIGDSSCNDDAACADNEGTIKSGSCNGFQACIRNEVTIEKGRCNFDFACQGPPSS